jgi:hypothetical protein
MCSVHMPLPKLISSVLLSNGTTVLTKGERSNLLLEEVMTCIKNNMIARPKPLFTLELKSIS